MRTDPTDGRTDASCMPEERKIRFQFPSEEDPLSRMHSIRSPGGDANDALKLQSNAFSFSLAQSRGETLYAHHTPTLFLPFPEGRGRKGKKAGSILSYNIALVYIVYI